MRKQRDWLSDKAFKEDRIRLFFSGFTFYKYQIQIRMSHLENSGQKSPSSQSILSLLQSL